MLFRSPTESLPARIGLFVFSATLLASLCVTGLALDSLRDFVREADAQRFPAILDDRERVLDLWTDHRESELALLSEEFRGLRLSDESEGSLRSLAALGLRLRALLARRDHFARFSVQSRDGKPLLVIENDRVVDSGLGLRIPLGTGRLETSFASDALDSVLASSQLVAPTQLHLEPATPDEGDPPGGQEAPARYSRPYERMGAILRIDNPQGIASPLAASLGKLLAICLTLTVVLGLAAYRVAETIVRPIHALSDAAERMSRGERGVRLPATGGRDELERLTQSFNEMSERLTEGALELESRNDELQKMNEVLEQLSITDGLTKLHNHRFFQDHLSREAKRADRTGRPLTLILFDIDHFKRWNDRLGHAAGDVLLRRVAEVLTGGTRETDLLARYGGEEFALVAPHTDLAGAVSLGEKLRASIAETSFFLDPPSEREQVTVSVGVALYEGDREALFANADQALYRAKSSGRDCVMGYGLADFP